MEAVFMSMAPLRRGGAFALLAGIVFLLGVTLYQGLVLAPTGFLAATVPISQHQQFGPYLVWASRHAAIDAGFRAVEATTFVLALAVPGALGRLLWPDDGPQATRALWAGRLGFAAFIVQIGLTTLATPLLARQYVSQPTNQAATLHTYGLLFGGETILASVVGGGLITTFLALASLRGSASGRLPGWLAYVGLATAGLLGVSALFALFAPTQPETPTSAIAFLGLSAWFIAIGILLLSVQLRPLRDMGMSREAIDDPAPTSDSTPRA
jgi:hypothetical protein